MADSPLLIESLDTLPARPVTWLWPGRLARGKLVMFDGDPGLGKSMVTLDLCARISRGRPFPDCSPGPPPGNVLIFHGEDTAEDVVIPRLDALGADRSRIFHVHRRHEFGLEPLCFPTHLPLLEKTLQRVRPLLVVMDPIMAFLDRSVSTGNDPSVRGVLNPLAQLAEKYDTAAILVRNLNKAAGKGSLYRGAGSIAFLAVCRSAWLFARDPRNPVQAVIAQVKNNLAARQDSLVYEIIAGGKHLELAWRGRCTLTAADLLRWAERQYPARLRARDFLASFLQDGPVPSDLIWQAARELGISKSTLNRAKKELDVRTQQTVDAGQNIYYWLLKKHKAPFSTDPDIRAFERLIEDGGARLPLRNPLDPVA
ncbi:MAG TPA: AAA family ATPase [Gemmataceae bacterium]|nr:AAA family ATPase [Gemmataceae bacterium]